MQQGHASLSSAPSSLLERRPPSNGVSRIPGFYIHSPLVTQAKNGNREARSIEFKFPNCSSHRRFGGACNGLTPVGRSCQEYARISSRTKNERMKRAAHARSNSRESKVRKLKSRRNMAGHESHGVERSISQLFTAAKRPNHFSRPFVGRVQRRRRAVAL